VVGLALALQGRDVALEGRLVEVGAAAFLLAQDDLHTFVHAVLVLLLLIQLDALLDGELDALGLGLLDCQVHGVYLVLGEVEPLLHVPVHLSGGRLTFSRSWITPISSSDCRRPGL
jgi:hypothetical protein